jgi:hypothetical protein
LRLWALEAVPPGWRDDELINIHALSGQVLAGQFPLYFTGASGHEPLYHYLHAAVHAVLGFNVLSAHILSVALGTLTVALTRVLTRRLLTRGAARVASWTLALSFWSLMYSRTAIRHISLPPLAVATVYLLWRTLQSRNRPAQRRHALLLGLVVGVSLYTYPAARLLPVLVTATAAYLAILHRPLWRTQRRGLLLALGLAALLALPLGLVLARQSGADARISELAVPLRALREGNPAVLGRYAVTTLGMFHATGDPEWLYNIPGRPLFNLLGGLLFWLGVLICLIRWRRPRYFLLLLWMGLGLTPAFLSTPPASLSHTILAQPAAYVLPAVALTTPFETFRRWGATRRAVRIGGTLLALLFVVTNAARDLRDYFVVWPRLDMVRYLYRADYRDAAHSLNEHPEVTDVTMTSALFGMWDRLALALDTERSDPGVRLFNPQRALIWTAPGDPTLVLLTFYPPPEPPIEGLLATGAAPLPGTPTPNALTLEAREDLFPERALARFENGLELVDARWIETPAPAGEGTWILRTAWRVAEPLDLPAQPVVANPPPPGVYSGPRLRVFAHLLADDGAPLEVDDGLWVDPWTLRPGDRFIQVHRFPAPTGAGAPRHAALGLYDPKTGERWPIVDDAQAGERVLIPLPGR